MGSRELSQVGLAAWFLEWNFLAATCLEGTQSQGRRRPLSGGIWPQGAKTWFAQPSLCVGCSGPCCPERQPPPDSRDFSEPPGQGQLLARNGGF